MGDGGREGGEREEKNRVIRETVWGEKVRGY